MEFRQHQPVKNKREDVGKEHMYKFLYMVGNHEFYVKNQKIVDLGNTRMYRLIDSKFVVDLKQEESNGI